MSRAQQNLKPILPNKDDSYQLPPEYFGKKEYTLSIYDDAIVVYESDLGIEIGRVAYTDELKELYESQCAYYVNNIRPTLEGEFLKHAKTFWQREGL